MDVVIWTAMVKIKWVSRRPRFKHSVDGIGILLVPIYCRFGKLSRMSVRHSDFGCILVWKKNSSDVLYMGKQDCRHHRTIYQSFNNIEITVLCIHRCAALILLYLYFIIYNNMIEWRYNWKKPLVSIITTRPRFSKNWKIVVLFYHILRRMTLQ